MLSITMRKLFLFDFHAFAIVVDSRPAFNDTRLLAFLGFYGL
jgi:hypothetical protein